VTLITPLVAARSAGVAGDQRPRLGGKWLMVGGEKFWVRGVTYGTFRPTPDDEGGYRPEEVERDFALMAAARLNSVRLYTPPPRWLLDRAVEHGLRVMVGLPWEQHIAFLEERGRPRAIERRLRASVRALAGHPGVLCYAIGNEIPAPVVRWLGARRVERFLHRLYDAAKGEDPDGLVTYVNYPSTEYLELPFLDLVAHNVYLEQQERYEAYLARLHNLAGDRPLLMAEIGLDSRRNGTEAQARSLEWQVRSAFAAGCAGTFVFAWTDEWHRGGHEIEDWDFGLVDREREPKPALDAVRRAYTEVPFPADTRWPRISVVVCSYNGSRTIRDTLDGLIRMDYPDAELIVVNDGSKDATPAIVEEYAARHPIRVLSQENSGLSAARNAGLAAATGEIVAYIDDDAYPDPHWLRYLAWRYLHSEFAAVGGPNIPPPGDGEVAECVANAPGGPVHVLVTDTVAEHIPGCNMSFRAERLRAVGGFDHGYRVAGDDVDACWRVQDAGGVIGFHPAAVVWHHRRNEIGTYWRQQQGYGKAEALLEQKWPERYNAMGHLRWTGRLYGKGWTVALRRGAGSVYGGTWGTAAYQSLYDTGVGTLRSLPLMPEWFLLVAALAGLSVLGLAWRPLLVALPLLLLTLAAPVGQAVLSARRATFTSANLGRRRRWRLRAITALLHLMQPVARLKGRLRHGLTPWRVRGRRVLALPRQRRWALWSEEWRASEVRLRGIEERIRETGAVVQRGGDFDRWDLEVRGGVLGGARLRSMIEEHGAGRQLVRYAVWARLSVKALVVAVGFATLAGLAALDGAPVAAIALASAAVLVAARVTLEGGGAAAALLRALPEAGSVPVELRS
jgi:O-antigen biosynthesis protein